MEAAMISDADSLFEKNLRLWESYYPQAAFIFDLAAGRGIVEKAVIKPAATGDDNLCCTIGEGDIYFHAQGNPKREADEWFSKLDLGGVSVLYVYGIGLGYYYDAAKKWLEENSGRSIVFLEDETEVLRTFLGTERCKRMLEDPQATFFYSKYNEIALFNEMAMLHAMKLYKISELKTYHKIKQREFDLLRSTLDYLSDITNKTLKEHFDYGLGFYRNYFLNILTLSSSKLGTALFDKFKGLPVVICGAGPSLADNGKQLADLTDRALIFAGGSGMNALNALGVVPHFGVGVDPNPDQFTRLVMNTAYETPYFYRCRMNNAALQAVHGERLYLTGSSGYSIAKWMENKLGIESIDFQEGHNVLTLSVVIAQLTGASTVICTGIDLAYSKGQSYSAGMSSHPIHPYSEHFKTKHVEEDLIRQKDINGKEVMSLWKWISESLWYSGFAMAHPELKLLNATEGGIGFERIENLPLTEVAKRYLQKEYDIAGRVHGEIAMSQLPSACNDEHIREVILHLADSLEECRDLCRELKAKLLKKAADPSQKATLDGEIDGLKETLLGKEGYEAVLKPMETILAKYHNLQLVMHDLREPGIDEDKKIGLKAASEAEVIGRLKDTAELNAALIRRIIADLSVSDAREAPGVEAQPPGTLAPSAGEKYHFDGKTYELIDPDLDIHFNEKGAVYEREVLTYTSGLLKMETHYKGGRIHGPSRFYDEQGKLLSESWFINGKRSGKMKTYHLGGALHSVRGYKEGKKSGIHRYFYPDGRPRSLLPYSEDLLSGEVELYHPGGIPERKLTFVDGVREGFDRIWDSKGQLRIEAEFVQGNAKGIAKEWYPNGTLEKEVVYGPNSEFVEKRTWNASGMLIKQMNKADFFEQVNVESENLMAAIGGMVSKIENILPAMKYREELIDFARQREGSNAAMDDIQSQLKQLKTKMEHLQEVGKEIEKWRKGDNRQTTEDLWKTGALRTEIEGSLKKQGVEMNKEMDKIRQGIKDIIEKLKK